MTAIVRGRIPASEFALHHVLESLPEIRFEVERIIESSDGAVMPLVWVRGVEQGAIERAIEEDPTVADGTLLEAFDGEFLFRMEWSDQVGLLLQMVTNWDATVLDAYGGDDRWQLRVLFPNQALVSDTHEFCASHGLTFEIETIRELDGEPAGRFGLTEEQYTALVLAAERGYYSVPQDVTLQELAAELDVSHQALSERLRRGTEALIEDSLLIATFPDED